jgi:apolipoprotein N-acyltransferase
MNGLYSRQLMNFAKEIQKPILTGGFSAKNFKTYNAVFLIGPQGIPLTEPYHKTNLLVFGEYTPLTDYFPKLAQISPAGMGFAKGTGPQIFPFQNIKHNLKIGPQVCYESLYPEFSAELAKLGADVLINITNDSWFGPTAEPYLHLVMTEARAIETRRPLLRNTNTGITTAILADGTELERSKWFTEWTGFFEIKFLENAEITFYSKYFQLINLFIILFTFMVIFMGRKTSDQKLRK